MHLFFYFLTRNSVSLDLHAAADVGVKTLKHFFLKFKPRLLSMMHSHTDRVHPELRLLLRKTLKSAERPVDSPNGGGLVRWEGQVSSWPRPLP